MSSTERLRRIRKFFLRELTPRAERLRDRNARLFPMGPDDDETWYVGPPEGDDFVEIHSRDLTSVLRQHWRSEGFLELAELAGPLLELAEATQVKEQDSSDVSPFVYVMY